MRTVHPTGKLAVVELRETSGPAAGLLVIVVEPAPPHLEKNPLTQIGLLRDPQQRQSSMDQFMPKSMFVVKQGQIDIALAKMIATDFQPFSIMEDRGF